MAHPYKPPPHSSARANWEFTSPVKELRDKLGVVENIVDQLKLRTDDDFALIDDNKEKILKLENTLKLQEEHIMSLMAQVKKVRNESTILTKNYAKMEQQCKVLEGFVNHCLGEMVARGMFDQVPLDPAAVFSAVLLNEMETNMRTTATADALANFRS